MTRSNITMQKQRKLLCFISFILILIGSGYSQTPPPKGASSKTIEYKATDYIAVGYVYKKQFTEGQKITFLSKQTQDTIIGGRYFMSNGIAYIDGIWKRDTENGKTRAKGVFKVTNSTGIDLTIKPKEGKPLTIEAKDIYYYQGFRNKYPAVLEKQRDNSYLLTVKYTDRHEANDMIKLELIASKDLIDKYGFFAIDDFVYYTTDVTRTFNSGAIFIGKVENTKTEDGLVNSQYREGKWTFTTGDYDEKELTKQLDGNYKYKAVYSDRKQNNNFAKMEIVVNKSLVEKYGFWATGDYNYYTPEVKYTYKNGNVFTGKQEHTRDTINKFISSQLTQGELKYITGEVFQGDLSKQWFCGVPITGKMRFTDGSIEQGNWLQKYNLTQNEADKVEKGNSPTEKRTVAKNIYKERQYQNIIYEAKYALAIKDYQTAKEKYLEALNIKPDESKSINPQIEKVEKLLAEQKRLNVLVNKYGDYYGELIYNKEFTSGMTKAMVKEIVKENERYYKKSVLTSSGNLIEVWEFDINIANAAIGMFGELAYWGFASIQRKCPTLVFKNGKLTDIYR